MKTSYGVVSTSRVLHLFTSNTIYDLIARYAHTILDSIGVTTNWSSDTNEKIVYKANVTGCSLVIHDDTISEETLSFLKKKLGDQVKFFDMSRFEEEGNIEIDTDHTVDMIEPVSGERTRFIIFTSGTTGDPKGVRLTWDNYVINAKTFRSFLLPPQEDSDDRDFTAIVVNPMHHTNSTSITDWAVRDEKSRLHLFSQYSTNFWAEIDEIIRSTPRSTAVIAPLVSRHIDFLSSLSESTPSCLPSTMKESLTRTILLLGSAPVGPKTIENLQKYAGTLPTVRFGSTETTLQVCGTPVNSTTVADYEMGWNHTYKSIPSPGYYIGRAHEPFTEIEVVESVDRNSINFLKKCKRGVPGKLVCSGGNVMAGYVNASTEDALVDDHFGKTVYLNLGDVCFWLDGADGEERNFYWMSRDSSMLIRGGANYSYSQIEIELVKLFNSAYPDIHNFSLAVVGLRLKSEHEDECCVTIELSDAIDEAEVESSFMEKVGKHASKGARPDMVRFAKIGKNFKGAVLTKELKQDCEEWATKAAKAK